MKVARLAAGAISLLLLAAGCSPTPPSTDTSALPSTVASPTGAETSPDRQDLPVPDTKPAGFVDPPTGQGMQRYLKQTVAWSKCGEHQCARVKVPLDYSDPDGQAITVAMKRQQATAATRIGTLFINPGGPGASGQDYVDSFDDTGLEGFDIVGWDPRGSGESTPVKCFSAKDTDAYLELDSSPDTDAENQALIDGTKKFARSCLENSGSLLAHISTQDTARDLDLLRQLQGDKELYYDGVSYGTLIGATYAQLFPDKVGRLVLDGAVNITDDESVIQAMGFETAFQAFAEWSAKQGSGLGSSATEVKASIAAWLDELDADPIAVGDRELTQTLAATGIALFLYGDESQYENLLGSIQAAMEGDGQYLLAAADILNDRRDGKYGSLFYSFAAILCVDNPDRGIKGAYATWRQDETKSPFFAKYFGVGYTCPVWAAQPAKDLTITAPGAKPIMVIGGTGDSATPYKQAQWMAEQLDSGFLLTFDGAGHGAYGGKSSCIDKAVVAYLTKGTVPAENTTCKPD